MESETRKMWNCTRCGHQWFSHNNKTPIVCANCKNPYWDIPKKDKFDVEVDVNDGRTERNDEGIVKN